MANIPRAYMQLYISAMKVGKVYLLVGARRVGKTFLLKQVAKEFPGKVLYINAEDQKNQQHGFLARSKDALKKEDEYPEKP